MKKIISFALCLLICSASIEAQEENAKYKINPTKDQTSAEKLYIPANLEDCFKELKKMLSPELIEEMKNGKEEDMAQYHHGLGTWIRNNWGLWGNSRLKKYFNGLGVHHPDDMSGIILTSFWRDLNKKPTQLKEQIKYYRQYWEKVKEKGN